MAKTFKLNDCSLTGELRAHLKDEYSMLVPEYIINNVYQSLFQSCALMVKYHSDKKYRKIGFSFKDINGEFIFGTILTFTPPEDEESEDGGNWNLDMTFNKDDMEECDNSLDNFSDVYFTILNTQMYSQFRGHCASNRDLSIIISECMKAILNFLDSNSNETNEDVSLEMDDVFMATVGFENGRKVYTITPGAAIKQIVKNDDAVEKKEIVAEDTKSVEYAAAAYAASLGVPFHVVAPSFGITQFDPYRIGHRSVQQPVYTGMPGYFTQPIVQQPYSPISILQ